MGFLPSFIAAHPRLSGISSLLVGLLAGISLSLTSSSLLKSYEERKRKAAEDRLLELPERPIEVRSDEIVSGVSGLIGAQVGHSPETKLSFRQAIRLSSGSTH